MNRGEPKKVTAKVTLEYVGLDAGARWCSYTDCTDIAGVYTLCIGGSTTRIPLCVKHAEALVKPSSYDPTTAEGVANILSDFVNRGGVNHRMALGWGNGLYSHEPSPVVTEMLHDHPTLLQEKMRLCMQYVSAIAELRYVDARDEDSRRLARAIIERCQDELPLRFI